MKKDRVLGKKLLSPFLWPAAALYGLGVRFRFWLYRRGVLKVRRLPLGVISLGNLTAGGAGKTPHAALLAGYLKEKGLRVAVLSRGYRGTLMKKGGIISDGRNILGTVEEGGEEPFWLAQKLPGVPVVVGRDRYRSGLTAAEKWQTRWAVLDDGFQHVGLGRDIDILLWSGRRSLETERLLPLGLLREPLEEMKRADVILITHGERLNPAERKDLAGKIGFRAPVRPIFFSEHKPAALWNLADKKKLSLSRLQGKRPLAFCGLADPGSFAFSLRELRVDPVRLVEFPDHHHYREIDKKTLESLSRSLNTDLLITTEKDALKLGKWQPAGLQVLVLGIEVVIADPAFWQWLDEKAGLRPKL